MHIVYDHQIFSMQVYGGISRYFYELATRVAKNDKYDIKINCPLYATKYLKNINSKILKGKYLPQLPLNSYTSRILPVATEARKLINSLIVGRMFKKITPDIVHETYYSQNKLAPQKTKTVITVYDMIHEKFRSDFSSQDITSLLKAKAINRADHIICISENTRRDLIEMLSVDPAKTSVVHLGYSLTAYVQTLDHPVIAEPYILFVGGRYGYKNFSRLLNAYAASERLMKDFRLVCMGAGRLSHSELREINRLGIAKNRIVHLSGGDEILANLYSHASAFVFPSLYEGFGIPALEAMHHHCPVISSNTGSLPEVAGEAAEYFDPYEIESIRSSIEKVAYSTHRSEELIKLGLERIKLFSWDKCAEQTALIYSVLG